MAYLDHDNSFNKRVCILNTYSHFYYKGESFIKEKLKIITIGCHKLIK